MVKSRLVALLLALALALAVAPAVVAQEESASDEQPNAAFDSSSIPEANQDEALILYLALRNALLAAGVSEGDLGAAAAWLEGEVGNLSEADIDELLAGQMLADSDAEAGDDEFGQSEEEEPELGDDEMGDDEEEEEGE